MMIDVCTVCHKTATGSMNVANGAAGSVPSRFERRCDDHMPYRFNQHHVANPDPAPTPVRQGALSEDEIAEIRSWLNACRTWGDGEENLWRALNEIDRLREREAHLLAQHEAAAQIIGEHIAALGDWQRASERDGQVIAGLRDTLAFELDEGQRARQVVVSLTEKLAEERAATARLRAQISTARAQLDAWQGNEPGATVQAAAATLAAGPGPEAPEPAAGQHDCAGCGSPADAERMRRDFVVGAGGFAVQALVESARAGNSIEIPSLGVTLTAANLTPDDPEPAAPEPREARDGD